MQRSYLLKKLSIPHVRDLLIILTIASLCLLWRNDAIAHAPEENYIWVNVESDHISGRFEVNVNDVRNKLGIDVDAEGATRLDGVQATQQQLQNYFLNHFKIEDSQRTLEIEFQDARPFEENPNFLQYPFRINQLPIDNKITISNNIFLTPDLMKDDKLHRSLVVVEYNRLTDKEFGSENVALVFSPKKSRMEVDLENPGSALIWKDFLWQGVLHIGAGFDHVLFIVLLLLTAAFNRSNHGWEPLPSFGPALWNTLKIVTTFTIAHSITLSLAALNLVSINISLVETVIAVSIIAVAFNNIFPKYMSHTWVLIFLFGLFHGLGFASVMGDLQFRTVLIERILILFNVGVEIGQIAIACLVFPVLFLLRKYKYYKELIINPISVIAACVAGFWALQRSGVLS